MSDHNKNDDKMVSVVKSASQLTILILQTRNNGMTAHIWEAWKVYIWHFPVTKIGFNYFSTH